LVRRYTDYDPLAWLYQQHWGREYHDQAYPVLQRLLLDRLPARASILDLCCGDGRLTLELANQGYRMTGVDGSEKMLRFARRRAPKVPFAIGDARSFRVRRRFEAVIATFDALNHIMSATELQQVCASVWRALKAGGYFAFDLNREEAYTDLWSNISTAIEEDNVSIARGAYDAQSGYAMCDITLFRLIRGAWRRSDFRLTQKYHSDGEVFEALSSAGFRRIEARDAATDLGMRGNIGQGRTYYLAQRD
jgi:SAM-dependent methyltransferase